MTGTQTRLALPEVLRAHAHPLGPSAASLDPLLDRIGHAPVVLLGEASHGTHEFYRLRAEITKRLIRERGFGGVAIEGDWPDAWRVHRYVRGVGTDRDAAEALSDFRRFPQWMWRNADVLDFVGWLRSHNDQRPAAERVGFYGLDLYSLHASIDAVIRYLDRVDPAAAAEARHHYACFDPFGIEPQRYGHLVSAGFVEGCRDEVVAELLALRRAAGRHRRQDHETGEAEQFFAEQNARVVVRAEAYYRAMFGGRDVSWNLRDQHMAETLEAVLAFLGQHAEVPRLVVWAHNSHVGDARATERTRAGELNLGQLVREQRGDGAVLVGFTTHGGTVTAAHNWDEPPGRRTVRPALAGSWEDVLDQVRLPSYLLIPGESPALAAALTTSRLHRAIGVVYRPETERQSHYYHTRLALQFDAILHHSQTRAVEPLERTPRWDRGEAPETWPTGL